MENVGKTACVELCRLSEPLGPGKTGHCIAIISGILEEEIYTSKGYLTYIEIPL